MKIIRILAALALLLGAALCSLAAEPSNTEALRTTTPLMENWKFIQDDKLTDEAALASTAADWKAVQLPHTWNAEDAAGLHVTKPYKRGLGWYRLEFDTPPAGARHWLEFGAASIVADVWLNGQKLGQHKGAFTLFRFDVTGNLPAGGRNVLLVKTDNSEAKQNIDPTAIIPLVGDFNMSGGLYRSVSLVSTPDPVHFDLGDLGGPGVYAATTLITNGSATLQVRSRLKSDAKQDGDYTLRASFLEADGQVARSAQTKVSLKAGENQVASQVLEVAQAHLWQGLEDPYLYQLVLELLRADGTPIDKVVQSFGIREMHFDVAEGFFLNGKHVPLQGVGMHQDLLGKGWALSNQDFDNALALIKGIGANTVRLAHYPYHPYFLEGLDKAGLVAWAEVPFGIGVTVQPLVQVGITSTSCPDQDPPEAFRANADLQLREMIRQQFNHPSIAMWAIGNEVTFQSKDCPAAPYDNITPLLRELQGVAKEEDPGRVTTLADNISKVIQPLQGKYIAVGGISDIWAINQYYLWYSGPVIGLGEQLDALHARYPNQPIGMSEYGAGAALTHHTDNPMGGPPESANPGVPVVYQPEEYAAYVHEQEYALLLSRKYLWGTYVWNMFDFGSGTRNEGDVQGVNTKGLVTFDHQTRKDPFFFYKANWSREPVTYIVGRRYTNRAYPLVDVKVYSNADSVELSVNGKSAGSLTSDKSLLKTYVFKNVRLNPGPNKLTAVGNHAGKSFNDSVDWSLNTSDINIAAGQLATGFKSSTGALFGSDNFFIGGMNYYLVEKGTGGTTDTTPVSGTSEPDLYKNYRHGQFAYEIPLEDGDYQVTLGFLEPYRITSVGNRIFDVVANGETKLQNFDVLEVTAGEYRTAVTRRFPVNVSGGKLRLDFLPVRGEAVVSNIQIKKQPSGLLSPTGRTDDNKSSRPEEQKQR
jgi:beta-galactosidase